MSFRINTNVSAMNTFRNLNMTNADMTKSITRLSTGLRINSGADDPAGLIASEGYRAQIGSIDAAMRNNQDAINLAKTAEGGLDEVSRLLREARGLAVTNGNSTLDATQKQANQTQLNNIISSITRISQSTSFGTKKLLDGSAGTQAGVVNAARVSKTAFSGTFNGASITASGAVDVTVTTAAERATLTGTKTTLTAATDLVGAGTFSLNGTSFTTTSATTRDQLLQQINAAGETTGITATITGNAFVFTSTAYGADAKINLVDSNGIVQTAASAATDSGVDAVANVTFGGATVAFNKGKGLQLKDGDGNVIELTSAGNLTAGAQAGVVQVNVGASNFQIGANANQVASLSLGNFNAASLGISTLDITGANTTTALTALDSAIQTVANSRATIGSFMRNTLESNVRSLGVAKENLSATESSLREIDVAEEMTQYTKLQILAQSGLSMLAQANSAPQSVLSLLR